MLEPVIDDEQQSHIRRCKRIIFILSKIILYGGFIVVLFQHDARS